MAPRPIGGASWGGAQLRGPVELKMETVSMLAAGVVLMVVVYILSGMLLRRPHTGARV